MASSDAPDALPFWESERAAIVKWQDIDRVWHEGPIASADDALETEHYILRVGTEEGDRFYTVHYPPTEDFDLDYEIDRIFAEYSDELG